jgi:hypothetical protein
MMNDQDQPIERLNYYNGQRLEAVDFLLEQSYHIGVRRWLNKSLFNWGIAAGLEVTVKVGDAHTLIVSAGLALDYLGREIILTEDAEVKVVGIPSQIEGVVFGNFLTIRYAEMVVESVEDGCKVPANGNHKTGVRLGWGGPTRVLAEPVLEWQNSWPADDSGMVVLVQAELDENCAVRDIRTGVRKYVGMSQPPRALTYALEGEKDINSDNPKVLYFHIRGGRPDAVTFYLRGGLFTNLFYTELGRHTHSVTVSLTSDAGESAHTHGLGELSTSSAGSHTHTVHANTEDTSEDHNALEMHGADNLGTNLTSRADMNLSDAGNHSHIIAAGEVTDSAGAISSHNHTATTVVGNAGQSTLARAGSSYTYPDGLQVWVDNQDYTAEILNRLGWTEMGDGTSGHALVQNGTGPIQLDLLGVDFFEGEHTIELRVPSGGGHVIYNLYVE